MVNLGWNRWYCRSTIKINCQKQVVSSYWIKYGRHTKHKIYGYLCWKPLRMDYDRASLLLSLSMCCPYFSSESILERAKNYHASQSHWTYYCLCQLGYYWNHSWIEVAKQGSQFIKHHFVWWYHWYPNHTRYSVWSSYLVIWWSC